MQEYLGHMEVASEFHKPSFHGQPTLFQESQQTLQQKEISNEEQIIILTTPFITFSLY